MVDRRTVSELYMFDMHMNSVKKKEYIFVLMQGYGSLYYAILDNDPYLSTLASIFTYKQPWTDIVKSALQDPNSTEVAFEESRVIINGDWVTVQPALYKKPEKYAFKISRLELLNLIDEWNLLMQRRPAAILLKKSSEGKITLEANIN